MINPLVLKKYDNLFNELAIKETSVRRESFLVDAPLQFPGLNSHNTTAENNQEPLSRMSSLQKLSHKVSYKHLAETTIDIGKIH
jgi:hypothetical protein